MPWTVYNSDGKILQSAEVGNDSITNAKMADDAVGADELAANAVVNASIASGAAIDATKIADGSVTSTEFQYINTLSSNAQTQIALKAPIATPTFTTSITIGSATITEAELEILDGATVSTAELNLLDGVSGLVQADLTKLAAIDATAAEIDLLDALDRGSIVYGHSSGATTVLGQGSADTVLTSDGTDIAWQAAGGGISAAQMMAYESGPTYTGDFGLGSAQAWCEFNAGGTIKAEYNVTSITDNSTGYWEVNFTGSHGGSAGTSNVRPFNSLNTGYAKLVACNIAVGSSFHVFAIVNSDDSKCEIKCRDDSGNLNDGGGSATFSFAGFTNEYRGMA